MTSTNSVTFYFQNPETKEKEFIPYPLKLKKYPKFTLQEFIHLEFFDTVIANNSSNFNSSNNLNEAVEIEFNHRTALIQLVTGEFTKINVENHQILNSKEIRDIHNSLNYFGVSKELMYRWYVDVIIDPLFKYFRTNVFLWGRASQTSEKLQKFVEEHYVGKNYHITTAHAPIHNQCISLNPMFTESFFLKHPYLINWIFILRNRSISNAFIYNHYKLALTDLPESERTFEAFLRKFTNVNIAMRDADFLKDNYELLKRTHPQLYQSLHNHPFEVIYPFLPQLTKENWDYIWNLPIPEGILDHCITHLGVKVIYDTSHDVSHFSREFCKKHGIKHASETLEYQQLLYGPYQIYTMAEIQDAKTIVSHSESYSEGFDEDEYDPENPDDPNRDFEIKWCNMLSYPYRGYDDNLLTEVVNRIDSESHIEFFYKTFPMSKEFIYKNLGGIMKNLEHFLQNPHIDIDTLIDILQKTPRDWGVKRNMWQFLLENQFESSQLYIRNQIYRLNFFDFDAAWKRYL